MILGGRRGRAIDEQWGERFMEPITRRTLLTTAAAAVALGSVGPLASAVAEESQTCDRRKADKSFQKFKELSSILTGITASLLVPDVDPAAEAKCKYFDRAKTVQPAFNALLERFETEQTKALEAHADDLELTGVADIVLNQSGPDIGNLARSIMLAWFLGTWYAPDSLAQYRSKSPPLEPLLFTVISAEAYTQGWIWRVAQAHPMGYSNLRFGHWETAPLSSQVDPSQFTIGNH
jgi:hypothetical protein